MDRAIQIAGATYESVPSVTIPTTGGGEASFVEISDTTAVATDVAAGKVFYTSEGVRTSGTASGGGGGVDYASGTYTPASAIRSFTVPVVFEPQFTLVVADPEDFVQNSDWKPSMVLNDFATNWHHHTMTRWLKDAYNSTGGAGNRILGTYSDGSFAFILPSSRYFTAGITYRWYLWRETR